MSVNRKIVPFEELESILSKERSKGNKVVLCHGVFDLIHSGHILHLKVAKQHGDKVVVSLTPDPFVNKGPNRPYFTEMIRAQNMAEIESVDYVVINQWPTAIETIYKLKPHVYMKGPDYATGSSDITGNIDKEKAAIEEIGGSIVFTEEPTFSSSNLLNKFFPLCSENAREYLDEFKKKHSVDQIFEYLDRMSELKVLIFGEAICDSYSYCLPLGKATKSAIVSTKYLSEELFLGGTLAIANHVSNFCKSATLVTTLGEEKEIRGFISKHLNSNVQLVNVNENNRPTIVKKRFIDQNSLAKLFEVQTMDDQPLSSVAQGKLLDQFSDLIQAHDLVIVADYGHGFFSDCLIDALTGLDRFLSVNVQTNSSNVGFNLVHKYRRANYVCIDEPELKLAVSHKHLDIEAMVKKLRAKSQFESMMVSLGDRGTVHFGSGKKIERTPIFSKDVVDRLGAGDALFSVTSPLAYLQCPSKILGFVANCAGGLAVKTMCNREQIAPVQLKKFIKATLA